jgi:hypothetical protein
MNIEKSIEIISEFILVKFHENDWDKNSFIIYKFNNYKIDNINYCIEFVLGSLELEIKGYLHSKIVLYKKYNIKDDDDIHIVVKDNIKCIYEIGVKYKYSKILDCLILKNEIEKQEELKLAINILTHKQIQNCCVCYDPNFLLTECNHSICRECLCNLKTKRCPMCRKRINNDIDDDSSDDENTIEFN